MQSPSQSQHINPDLYQHMQQIANIGGWELDLETQHVTWTEQIYHIHEVPVSYDPNLQNAIAFYLPESQEKLQAALAKAQHEGISSDIQLQIRTAKNRLVWVRDIIKPYYENGKITKLYGTFQDITEFKESVAALSRSLAVQGLLNDILQTFIGEDFDTAMQRVFTDLRQILDQKVDRMNIGEFPEGTDHVVFTHTWADENSPFNWDGWETVPLKEYRWLWDQLREHQPFVLVTDDLPPEMQAMQEGFAAESTICAVFVPLLDQDRLIGAFSVEITHTDYHWTEDDLDMLQMVGEVLVIAINRHKAQQALRESEVRFHRLYKNLPIPSSVWQRTKDDDFELIEFNDAAFDVKPGEEKRFLGMRMRDTFARASQIIEDFQQCYQAKSVINELRLYAYPGQETEGLLDITYVYLPPDMVITYYQDITEKKQNEKTLEYHSLLLDNMGDAVISSDAQFNIVSWNRGAEVIYGYAAEEVIGKPVAEVIRAYSLDGDMEQVLHGFLANGRWDGELMHRRRDGTTFPCYTVTTAIMDADGNMTGALAVNRDISAQKEAERHRLELQLAEEKAQLLSEFIGNMSHDLRTPLAVIHTSLHLLRQYRDEERRSQKIDVIQTQAAILENMIDSILIMSKLDQAPDMVTRPLALDVLAEEVCGELKVQADSKKIEMTFLRSPGERVYVQGNERDLYRIFTNLIENSIKYTHSGGDIIVEVFAYHDRALVRVMDTGTGIEDETIPHIFERFFRAEKHRDIGKGSAGLGLAIVKRIVELHDGTIEVESEPNKGTLFTVRFPLVDNPISS